MCNISAGMKVLNKAKELWVEDTIYWGKYESLDDVSRSWDEVPMVDKLHFMKIASHFYLLENVIIDEDTGCFLAKTDFKSGQDDQKSGPKTLLRKRY